MAESKYIEIKGAREHNLKNVNISIPKNQLTVITGLSASYTHLTLPTKLVV